MRQSVAAAVAACAIALAGASPQPDAAAVIAAERAFAARGSEVPVKQAFLDYAAPDGVLVDSERGAENALQSIATWPDRDNAGFIKWWPLYAGVSGSGELGFTTGAARYGDGVRFTNYFTIWKKQPDGSWKWLIDVGAPLDRISHGPETPVTVAPAADPLNFEVSRAKSTLCSSETLLVTEARVDQAKAYGAWLAPEARVMGMEAHPAVGRDAYAAALAARPAKIEMRVLACDAAASGDLGYSYGAARWTSADGKPAQGVYLRVWQWRTGGWRILADLLTPDR